MKLMKIKNHPILIQNPSLLSPLGGLLVAHCDPCGAAVIHRAQDAAAEKLICLSFQEDAALSTGTFPTIRPPKGIEVRDFVLKFNFSWFSSIFIDFPLELY